MERRQNWHKFQRILGHLAPKKTGMVVLHSNNRVLAGAVGTPADVPVKKSFSDAGMGFEHLENAWEVLSHKYAASGATFIDREELLGTLGQIAAVRSGSPATDHFPAQMAKLRESLGIAKGERSKLATHFGDRPIDQYWPRKPFLFSFFRPFFGELFPERKLLLLSVVNDAHNMDTLLLEFQGKELKSFCEPDFSGLDWKGQDLFLRETASRFVLWCETHYMLPTYSLFLTSRVWEECREQQMRTNDKAAWKHLQKIRFQRDVEKEILFEPEPWPVRALLGWHSLRG